MGISSIESLLFSTHFMLGAILKSPEIVLSEDEAKKMAEASANVMKHYDVRASAKVVDWTNLIICLGMIYGPRAVAYAARVKKEKAEKAAAQPDMFGNVHPLRA